MRVAASIGSIGVYSSIGSGKGNNRRIGNQYPRNHVRALHHIEGEDEEHSHSDDDHIEVEIKNPISEIEKAAQEALRLAELEKVYRKMQLKDIEEGRLKLRPPLSNKGKSKGDKSKLDDFGYDTSNDDQKKAKITNKIAEINESGSGALKCVVASQNWCDPTKCEEVTNTCFACREDEVVMKFNDVPSTFKDFPLIPESDENYVCIRSDWEKVAAEMPNTEISEGPDVAFTVGISVGATICCFVFLCCCWCCSFDFSEETDSAYWGNEDSGWNPDIEKSEVEGGEADENKSIGVDGVHEKSNNKLPQPPKKISQGHVGARDKNGSKALDKSFVEPEQEQSDDRRSRHDERRKDRRSRYESNSTRDDGRSRHDSKSRDSRRSRYESNSTRDDRRKDDRRSRYDSKSRDSRRSQYNTERRNDRHSRYETGSIDKKIEDIPV